MPDLLTAFAIISAVLMIAALGSGLIERAPISLPMIFLGFGYLIGPVGLGLIRIGPQDAVLNVIGTLSLIFVLFLDAINLRFNEHANSWIVPILTLGPGTLLTMLFISIAAVFVLGLSPIHSFLLGAVLSSVDPVLLRAIVEDERIPRSIRQSLETEAGMNDVLVLPVLLILSTIAAGQVNTGADWIVFLARLFLLGPLAGAAVGIVSVLLIRLMRSVTPIRREFRALYGVGAVLAAYSAGETVGASGFLAVFAAGAWSLCSIKIIDSSKIYSIITIIIYI